MLRNRECTMVRHNSDDKIQNEMSKDCRCGGRMVHNIIHEKLRCMYVWVAQTSEKKPRTSSISYLKETDLLSNMLANQRVSVRKLVVMEEIRMVSSDKFFVNIRHEDRMIAEYISLS
ncbi:unnamed protein product [Cylicocyclus nassatus]|uniref:Uncharacterized protein n=1 Tax=Cylicocyclus nassatus TaxID=53992 RepID=A0AA36MHK3_CYLNA|nr:unnamed protein product [Cylicocyclus nassatus]